jgi:hypothetical protein
MGIYTGSTQIECVDCCGSKPLAHTKGGWCHCKGGTPTKTVALSGKLAFVCKICNGVVSI